MMMPARAQRDQQSSLHFLQNQKAFTHYKAAYRIPADSMAKWTLQEHINFDYINQLQPVWVGYDSIQYSDIPLPNGHFVWVRAVAESLHAWLDVRTGLSFNNIANGDQRLLSVYNLQGEVPAQMQASLQGKKLKWSAQSAGFVLPKRKKDMDDRLLIISTATDTLISWLSYEESSRYHYQKPLRQWPVIKQVLNTGRKISRIFSGDTYYNSNKSRRQLYRGFVLFNKPLYKPADTLKFKAWITDRKGNPIRSTQTVSIQYYYKNSSKKIELGQLEPTVPGSYHMSWPLPDSLPMDVHYDLHLQGPKAYNKLNSRFKTEEYQLPDISSFNVTTLQNWWLRKDSLRITLEAKDASGILLPDGSVELFLTRKTLQHFYPDSLFVPDTLWRKKIALLTDGPTLVYIPAYALPEANMETQLFAQLRNSSNELKEQQLTLTHYARQQRIVIERNSDSLHIRYETDGIPTVATAQIESMGDWYNLDTVVQLPLNMRIHPMASDYDVTVLDALGKKVVTKNYDLSQMRSTPAISNTSKGDTVSFVLNNPTGMPVWLAITKNKGRIQRMMLRQTTYSWQQHARKGDRYLVQVNYWEGDQERLLTERLQLQYNLLQVTPTVAPTAQPGAADTLTVKVTDYKGKPVAHANLTAVANNTQLQQHFRYPDMPVRIRLKRYKKVVQPGEFDNSEIAFKTDTVATRFAQILHQLHGDTMFYYQRLMDTGAIRIVRSPLNNAYPEASIYAIEKGKPAAIYVTHINNLPVHMWWQNAIQANSNIVYPGYSKISLRTWNKLIEIDSVYMQPYQKHDVFIQLDSAAWHPHVRITPMPDTLTHAEKTQLQRYFIQIENDRNSSGAWLWNYSLQAKLSYANGTYIAGPFMTFDSITIYNSSTNLHTKFPFESNYRYRISQHLVRLEKTELLPGKIKLRNQSMAWRLGDTTWNYELPLIEKKVADNRRNFSNYLLHSYSTDRRHGSLHLQYKTDSSIRFTILIKAGQYNTAMVFGGQPNIIHQLDTGYYQLVLVDKHDLAFNTTPFYIHTAGANALRIHAKAFTATNTAAYEIYAAQLRREFEKWQQSAAKQEESLTKMEEVLPGLASISGKVTDAVTGMPLSGVTVQLKNTKRAVSTGADGMYQFSNIASAQYTLVFQYVGYGTLERQRFARLYAHNTVDAALHVSHSSLEEVVVIGYGTTKKRSMTASVTTISGNALQGRVAGVNVTGNNGAMAETSIQIRGVNSMNGDISPLYVVDGILMDAMPGNLDPNTVSIEVLKDAVATAIYGSRGANGVIVITTSGNKAPSIRTRFSDDAYFVPDASTDKNGLARIPIRYPENITGWQHVVYAAAPKGKYGSAAIVSKTFKLLQGMLQVPAFLTEGDSIYLSGKAINYSQQTKQIKTSFGMRGQQTTQTVLANEGQSAISYFGIKAPAAFDTLKVQFTVADSLRNSDGEERTIPVLPAGTLDTKGRFFVLDHDTSFTYTPAYTDVPLQVYTENNLLNVLEKELESLRNYPQACMEQTANKMWGLLMMKQINERMNKAFKYDKQIAQLQTRLLENQQYGGGWGWWEKSSPNLYITTKVLQALRHADSSASVKQAIREGYIYLQNELPKNGRLAQLEALYSLSEGGHIYPYQFVLDSIPFDSLHIHAQWQYVRIKQKAGLPYSKELTKLWQQKQQTFTGSIYWGEDNWLWYRNRQSTMVIAGKTIAADSAYRQYSPQIKQYFIAEKQSVYYRNTVEQAEIINLLLSDALAKKMQTNSSTTLQVNEHRFTQFPNSAKLPGTGTVHIRKEGPGLVYLGLSQQKHVVPQVAKDSLFAVHTRLMSKQGDTLQMQQVKSGTTIILEVTVHANKDGEYVQLDIPIPAGCSYHSKPSGYWNEHREYRKEKLSVFIEKLPAGTHRYRVELDTRFNGIFRLNPAHIALMYFPVFEGYNRMQQVSISQ